MGLERIFWKPQEEIQKYLVETKFSAVSFDIFDTLIERLVDCPEDVFLLLEDQYCKHFKKNLPISLLRKFAEKKAYCRTSFSEVTLDEIYSEIDLPEEERRWLQEKEIELEVMLCVPKIPMCKLYARLQKAGKKVFLSSDMYLPKEVVERILERCGIHGYLRLYLSSDERKTKRDGSLFKELLRKEGLNPSDIVHIGDNVHSDYLIARHLGIRSLLLKNTRKKNAKTVSQTIVSNFIRHNKANYIDPLEQMGFSLLGPMLYGFSKWLKDFVAAEKFDSVLFLMREGELLKAAYERVGGDKQKGRLLYVSRQSTTLPFLEDATSFPQLLLMLQARRMNYTVNDLLCACRIRKGNLPGEEAFTEKRDDNVREWSQEEAAAFFKKLRPYLIRSAKENRKNFLQYLSVACHGKKNLMVDVGYHGTIQNNVQKILPEKEFFGAYLGHFISKEKPCAENAVGFYFNREDDARLFDIALTSGVFELLFLSTEGTTLSYDEGGNPILAQRDNDKEQTRRINNTQKAALEFVQNFQEIDKALQLDQVDWFSFYSEFARYPTQKNLVALKGLVFRDSRVEAMIPEKTRLHYLMHPRECLRDFVESPCKVFFLKWLCVIPLPYYWSLVWLRRFDIRCRRHRM